MIKDSSRVRIRARLRGTCLTLSKIRLALIDVEIILVLNDVEITLVPSHF